MSLREDLAAAGKRFDEHVTNGSLNAQIAIVEDAISAALAEDSEEYFARMAEYEERGCPQCGYVEPREET